jgi:hypothetical protein
MTDRTPPHDAEAERSAIGAVLSLGRIPDSLIDLVPSDFYIPTHEHLWHVIRHLVNGGGSCDANAVHARLMETAGKGDQMVRAALAVLPDLASGVWASTPDTLSAIILDRAGRRNLIAAHTAGLQMAYESDADYETQLQRSEAMLASVPAQDSGNVDTLMTLDEFLGQSVPEPEWVIEGLLARGERLILTGLEGWGKSTLCRQLGLCAAAGIEPFTGRRIQPKTVLLVDAENPNYIMQKRFSELRNAVRSHSGKIEEGRFWMDRKPGGMNLGEAGDRRWLQRRINVTNPDLLVIGPAYKLHDAGNDDKDETIARTVTSVLDDLRGQAALVLEHHAGNEQAGNQRPVRPFGSSLWRRWPEFGYGIRPIRPPKGMTDADVERGRYVDLVSWRGARDERNWPKQMQSGGEGLPWVEWTEDAA